MNNKLLQDSHGNTSSKRVFGAIGLALYFVIGSVVAVYTVYTGNDVGSNAVNLLNGFGLTGTALLGAGVIEHFAKGKDK
jgi:hypothetical protein